RDAQIHAGLAGMAGLAPGLPVGRELRLQIGGLRDAQADEDGQSHPAGRGKRLVAGGGHAKGRMRDLIRTRRDDRVLDPIELARVAERLALPALTDDLQRLAKACLALAVRHAIDVVRPHDAAATDAELEAPFADVIDGRDLFGDAQRMVQGQDLDGGPHPEPAGAGGDRARHLERGGDHRARRREVDLAEPDAVDAPGVRPLGQLEDVPEGRALARPLAHLLDADPEMHGVTNLRKDGRPLDRESRVRLFNLGNMLWHSDSSFRPIPAKYSLLSARVVNPVGGNTEFADMRAAYDALDADTKALIEDLVCEHSLMYSRGSLGMLDYSEEERAMFRPVRQRLVRTHPVSGRRSLYLSSHAGGIVGMPMP